MRSRNIKPGLFKNEILGEADPIYSLLFAGLWTLADKEGRLENRPKKIKAEIFPYRFDLDLSKALAWLNHESFITEYEIEGRSYLQINKWRKHQSPHHKEVESEIPPPEKAKETHKKQGDTHAQAKHEPSITQDQIKETTSSPLIPDSLNLIPDSLTGQNEFDRVWDLYGKKKKKKPAESAFRRLNKTDRENLLKHIPDRVKSDPQFARGYQPDLVTFINQRRWEDEDWRETPQQQSEATQSLSDNALLKKAQSMGVSTHGLTRDQLIQKVQRHRVTQRVSI